jgi:hypothetical protein
MEQLCETRKINERCAKKRRKRIENNYNKWKKRLLEGKKQLLEVRETTV